MKVNFKAWDQGQTEMEVSQVSGKFKTTRKSVINGGRSNLWDRQSQGQDYGVHTSKVRRL